MKSKSGKIETECCSGMSADKIKQGAAELKRLALKAKDKYDQSDEKTKKKILAGVVGAAALLTGVIGLRALKKKMKK